MTGPGRRVRALAARWCSAKTMERLVDPVLADLQTEYEEARGRGQRARSYWIWIASHVALFRAMAMHGRARAIEGVFNMTVDDWRNVMRTAAWSFATILVMTALLSLEPWRQTLARGGEEAMMLALLLVPQALPIAIPIGLVVAILQAVRQGPVTNASRAIIFGLALLLGVGSFATMAWIIPETNQQFRRTVFRQLAADGVAPPQTLARGPSELTFAELRRAAAEPRPASQLRPDSQRRPVPNFVYAYYVRWAISCSPLVLACFAVVVATRLTRGRTIRWLIACAVILGYWQIYFVLDREYDLDRTLPMLVAWAPNIGLLIVTATIAKLAPPRAQPA